MAPVVSDKKPKLKAPPGACDTHMHIYNAKYPKAPTAKILAPDAHVEDYLKMRARIGFSRTVIVQPSAYGKDNRCTLEGLAALGKDARAVVVVDQTTSDEEFEHLSELGACGIRFFMLSGAPLPWDILETMSERGAEHGWHIQLQLDGRQLADYEALLMRLKGPLVLDHTGKFLEPVGLGHPGFRTLLKLVDRGAWVKLSAPYETSKAGPPHYSDVGVLAKALVKAAPERMLWATNWPHPTPGVTAGDDADLLDVLLDWIPDEKTRNRVLADNPAKLYGF